MFEGTPAAETAPTATAAEKVKTTVPAKANDVVPKNPLLALISGDVMKKQFALALPKIVTPDRFVRVALTAMNKNPKLLSCTRESVLSCLMSCAELGIEPDGRRAHLIPFNDRKNQRVICTMIVDYKGKVELAMRSGLVASIHADKICENDEFVYNRGHVEKHIIDFRQDRGKAFAYYCIVTMKDGSEKSEVMTKKEIDDVRKRSRASGDGPWVTDYDEMAKKTVFHRVSKWIPQSPELRDLEAKEDDDGFIDPSSLIPVIPADAVVDDVPATGANGLAGSIE